MQMGASPADPPPPVPPGGAAANLTANQATNKFGWGQDGTPECKERTRKLLDLVLEKRPFDQSRGGNIELRWREVVDGLKGTPQNLSVLFQLLKRNKDAYGCDTQSWKTVKKFFDSVMFRYTRNDGADARTSGAFAARRCPTKHFLHVRHRARVPP